MNRDKDLMVIINRPVHSQGDPSPFQVIQLSEDAMDAIATIVYLDRKCDNQRNEISSIHYMREEAEKKEAEGYERGKEEGFEEGKRVTRAQIQSVNTAVSIAYQQGVEDGKQQAKGSEI